MSQPSSRSLVWLVQIREEANTIAGFVRDKSLKDYRSDKQLRYAVERALQRLTEAAHRLGNEGQQLLPSIAWTELRGFGNILRHGYDQLDDEVVWRSAVRDVPELKVRIEALIGA